MKDINYYMNKPYRMELYKDVTDGSYVLCFPDLPGCLTSGKTAVEAVQNAEDAKRCWLMAALEDCPDKIVEPSLPSVMQAAG